MKAPVPTAIVFAVTYTIALAQSPTPRFEVASIKPCKEAGPTPQSSPGRLSTGCLGLRGLIRQAYVLYASGRLVRDPSSPPVTGGPAWIDSERYEIDARAEGSPVEGEMRGPMLQRLLADRFALKLHSETREAPVYHLTVAKGGPKLHPFKEGSCIPMTIPLTPRGAPPGQKFCRVVPGERSGQEMAMDVEGLTLAGFAKMLDLVVDRPVIDKTGIAGLFDFHLEFGEDGTMIAVGGDPNFPRPAPSDERTGLSIFTAIQQYGLKLESAKGTREVLVVDSVERPSSN